MHTSVKRSPERAALPLLFLILHTTLPMDAADNQTVFPGEQWNKCEPEAVGMNAEKLATAVSYLKAHSGGDGVSELFIARRGYLIHEGDNVDKVHGVWSGTKSITSTCLGLLIDDRKCTLDSRAYKWVGDLKSDYKNVELRHFATMTSGYRAVGDTADGDYTHGPSRTPFAPAAPMFKPGEKYAYWDSAMNEFANVLTQIAEEPLDQLFKRKIADPIGMDSKAWRWGDFGEVEGIKVNGGAGNHGHGIEISARQMARFGHLFLNEGKWNNQQLISRNWVVIATSGRVLADTANAWMKSGINGPGVYGFNWWVNDIDDKGLRQWPGAPFSTYAASGYNNNKLFVIPDWDMVIVRLGLDEKDGKIARETWGEFLKKVGESISNQ